ncbi:MAG TPA: iron-containing redox enzyme family protein [Jatrophihabitans sp.]|nr:iron-containing redox enzyme family protein [Jatrophihabitans sp.]
MWRDLFRAAIDPEAFFDEGYLRTAMAAVAGDSAGGTPELAATVADLAGWSERQAAELGSVLAAAGTDDRTRAIRVLATQVAPMAATLGCPLHGLSAPGVFEDEVQLTALSLLADDCGGGIPLAARNDAQLQLLRSLGLTEVALPARELPEVAAIADDSYALPAVLCALTRRSDAFAFELLGIDRAFRAVGMLPAWSALRQHLPDGAADWARLDLGRASGRTELGDPVTVSARIAAAGSRCGPAEAGRVAAGAAWFAAAIEGWQRRLVQHLRAALDPELAMCALVADRAREAAVYHQGFPLEGRPLSAWLAEAGEQPLPLVRALGRSRLVRPGEPDRSSLVNGLISFRGPMFRIFSPADVAVIRRWITALPGTGDGRGAARVSCPVPPPEPTAEVPGVHPDGLRAAYHALQGRALAPQTRAFAAAYVRDWLAQSRTALDGTPRALPATWTRAGLRPWLLDQHDRHDREFGETSGGELPARDDLVDATLQLAPLTLIDGSWLQGFTDVNLASSRVGSRLFETYWDELGNGRLELNHPKIYRDVLRQMGIELPPTASREFAYDERIREESLRLPVYWLALGKFPATFLPEILGMNLAMELSGVGGGYRTARRALRHHGFSTRFVDIHNTIDNVSTGHSAWAAEAIDIFLRDRVDEADPDLTARLWQRVRVGFASLTPPPAKRQRRLAGRRRPSTPPAAGPRRLLHHTPIG